VVQKSESIAPHIGFHAFLTDSTWLRYFGNIKVHNYERDLARRDSQLANNGGFMKNA
jgi:hypothetical protein